MKIGPVFVIPCDRAQDLAKQIFDLGTDDPYLIDLANYLNSVTTGFALVCAAEKDFVLWPGGPDIRDYQLGGRESTTIVTTPEGTFSNRIQDSCVPEES